MVHKYPHEVTIYEGAPMTNLALAVSIDPDFPELVKELVFMGGSLNPESANPEFANNPRHEFNFWFDPEAAHMVLRAPWRKIICTPTDISIKTHMTAPMVKEIAESKTPLAEYVSKFAMLSPGADIMWDELAACAWLDPAIITKQRQLYMDVDISRGPSYGDTLTWTQELKPQIPVRLVHAQTDLDLPRFNNMFVQLMSTPTPK